MSSTSWLCRNNHVTMLTNQLASITSSFYFITPFLLCRYWLLHTQHDTGHDLPPRQWTRQWGGGEKGGAWHQAWVCIYWFAEHGSCGDWRRRRVLYIPAPQMARSHDHLMDGPLWWSSTRYVSSVCACLCACMCMCVCGVCVHCVYVCMHVCMCVGDLMLVKSSSVWTQVSGKRFKVWQPLCTADSLAPG